MPISGPLVQFCSYIQDNESGKKNWTSFLKNKLFVLRQLIAQQRVRDLTGISTGETKEVMKEAEAREFAQDWIAAWNAHDMEAILAHYASEVRLTSPAAASILNDPSGTVTGKEALSSYFRRGLEAYPNLRFELVDVMLRHFHRFNTLHLHCVVSPTPCWSRRL